MCLVAFFMGVHMEVGWLLGRMNYLGEGALGILEEGIEPQMAWGHFVAFMEACT